MSTINDTYAVVPAPEADMPVKNGESDFKEPRQETWQIMFQAPYGKTAWELLKELSHLEPEFERLGYKVTALRQW